MDAAPNPAVSQSFFNVKDFGASGAGRAVETKALQSAIDAAGSAGGGTVLFPAGTYLTGTLLMQSHVSLHLEGGAVLLGSTNLADYPPMRPKLRCSVDREVDKSIIYGEGLENISLAGRGRINGQGATFKEGDRTRPFLIRLVECRDVLVSGLTLLDSPMWVQQYLACDNLVIRGLTVHSRCNHNNDGIDIDSCQKVFISDCEIYSEDDAVCLKSSIERPCRDITITNCVVSSLCNGFKMGTGSVGGFQNVAINSSTVYDTTLSGIALEIVDGGLMENVMISNIAMRNVRSAIFLRLGNRAAPAYEGAPKPGLGSMRNITISNIQATGADKVGCAISGLPERSIENVSLDNIRFRFEGGGNFTDAARNPTERPEAYPEYNMFGVLPGYAFYCRHVKNLRFVNTQVALEHEDLRPALVCDDVDDVRLTDFQASNSKPLLLLRNTRNAWIESSRAPTGNEIFLRLEGKETKDIYVGNNNLRNSKKPVDTATDVPPDAVTMK